MLIRGSHLRTCGRVNCRNLQNLFLVWRTSPDLCELFLGPARGTRARTLFLRRESEARRLWRSSWKIAIWVIGRTPYCGAHKEAEARRTLGGRQQTSCSLDHGETRSSCEGSPTSRIIYGYLLISKITSRLLKLHFSDKTIEEYIFPPSVSVDQVKVCGVDFNVII